MRRPLLIVTLLLLCGWLSPLRAEQLDEERLRKVQVAYLLNFAKLITWQETPHGAQADQFIIGTYGGNPFGPGLDILAAKKVGPRKIVIRHCRSLAEAMGCHLLFIHPQCQEPLAPLLDFLHDKPVLTISSIPGFLEQGGLIELHLKGSHVLFSINQGKAQGIGLRIPSQVLALAQHVLVARP